MNILRRRLSAHLGGGGLRILGVLGAWALVVAGDQGQAHHLSELLEMRPTPFNGLLTGLLHPLLDPDHLLFLLALSLASLRQPLRWLVALLAVALIGSLIGLYLWEPLGGTGAVSFTLVIEALVLQNRLPRSFLLPAFALHGCLLGSSVLGWGTVPVGAFFSGLMLSQAALLLISLTLLRRLVTPMADWVRQLLATVLLGCGLIWTFANLMT